ncbi:MAG: hypothetical protein Kow0077_11700 [Anaerolineae bacterium]
MRYLKIALLLTGLIALMSGCNGLPGQGPRLVAEGSLIPTVAVLPSITPSPTITDTPTEAIPTPDFRAETEVALITPTLPPTRTPTLTWTPRPTATATPSPLPTQPPTLTPFPTPVPPPTRPVIVQQAPNPILTPSQQAVSAPPGAVNPGGQCAHPWFFSSRPGPGCPTGPAVTMAAASLAFERGMMFWLSNEQQIYVLYSDGQQPAWERYPDTYVEGMPERDPAIVGPQGLWQQPRRGFGLVWRTQPNVRNRLGWALREWEDAYTATVQQAGAESGGNLYLTGPDGIVYELAGSGAQWTRFAP